MVVYITRHIVKHYLLGNVHVDTIGSSVLYYEKKNHWKRIAKSIQNKQSIK